MNKIIEWYREKLQNDTSRVERIPFSRMENWFFDEGGNICHVSGKFFSVRGVRFVFGSSKLKQWEQPIIHQPEIGVLGILTKKIEGERYFLMQAKMEPGNINRVQISPTVQATMSNYLRVHNGKKTDYLNYFLKAPASKVLVDSLQTEQGGRFYQKRNRNIVVEVEESVAIKSNFCWVNESDFKSLFKEKNLVNMNARSVFSCYLTRNISNESENTPINSTIEILNFFTKLKLKYRSEAKIIDLKDVTEWERRDDEIRNINKKYFSIIALKTVSESREVTEWTQPIIKETQPGFIGFIIKKINGIDHYLVQAKQEPGNIDTLLMAPTIQSSYANLPRNSQYMWYFSNAKPDKVKYDVILSEEGGRFYHTQNKYMAVEIDDEIDLSDHHIWVSYPQLLEFIRYSLLNIEGRTLVAGINMGEDQ